MELFKKDLQIEIPFLDKPTAQEIYKKFKELGDKENVIDTGLFFPEHILDIMKEIEALYEVAYDAMMRVSGTYEQLVGEDNEMNPIYETVIIPPSPTTKEELVEELHSDILDVGLFVNDYIDYILVYKENTTWEEFLEQFTFLKLQNENLI